MAIHPTAIVDPKADVPQSAEVGPFCVIDADVRLARTRVGQTGACIKRDDRIEGLILGQARPGHLVAQPRGHGPLALARAHGLHGAAEGRLLGLQR